jgi:putative tryptophan/tyrosine transport system substrate-binding protein
MKRREFIAGLGSTAAWPLAARAQQPDRVRRVGVLMGLDETDPEGKAQLSRFMQGLAELGWTDGGNIQTDVRWGGDDVDRMRILAKELVAMRPDAILAEGTPVTAALQRETRTIPIVFVVVADPIGTGFVASINRPGGNITGFVNTEMSMGGKWLELLAEMAPGIKRAAMMFNPDTALYAHSYYLPSFVSAARSLNVEPIPAPVRNDTEIETVIASLASLGQEPRGGLIVMADHFTQIHVAPIALLAAQNRIPAIYPWRYVIAGNDGLLSYGPDLRDVVLRAAPYVDRILRGAKPADLPVQFPVKFEMAVNVKTAKALGLGVPQSILLRADEVIE